jgi:hypothetical protein
MSNKKHRKILNSKEASEYLGGFPSRRTLENWRRARKGPLYLQDEDGNFVGYDPDHLDLWKERLVTHPSEGAA